MLAEAEALVEADFEALVLAEAEALVEADLETLWLALIEADLEALAEVLWLATVEIDLLTEILSDVKSFKLLWTVSTVLSR